MANDKAKSAAQMALEGTLTSAKNEPGEITGVEFNDATTILGRSASRFFNPESSSERIVPAVRFGVPGLVMITALLQSIGQDLFIPMTRVAAIKHAKVN